MFFKNYFWIIYLWIRNSDNDDTPGCIIWKVNTFWKASSANTHQNCSFILLSILICCFFSENCFIVIFNHLLIFWRILWFFKQSFKFFNFFYYILFAPNIINSFQSSIRREKNQNASRSFFRNSHQCISKIFSSFKIVSIFIRKVELIII